MKKKYLSIIPAAAALILFIVFRNGAVAEINYDDDHYSNVYLSHIFTTTRSLELASSVILLVIAVLIYDGILGSKNPKHPRKQ